MYQGMIKGFAIAVRAVVLTMAVTATAMAAPTAKNDAPDFNHMTTGYPLTGAHAAAACETCHVGGVFKGTPKDCDGCHAAGRRIVATPKSTAHIVTTAACDTCHFNTVSFLGARFNHGAAKPGQCTSCHNGRQSRAKAANHNTGLKSTESCDKCHRTYAWEPATWNHTNTTPGSCATSGCHVQGSNQYFSPSAHSTPVQYTSRSKASFGGNCEYCHSFTSWFPGTFKHTVAGACDSCHTVKAGHIALNGATCDTCHRTRSNGWLPASNHSGNEAGICRTCHATTPQPSSHTAVEFTSKSCDACHRSQTTWQGALGAKPSNHIPEGSAPSCSTCHTSSTSTLRGSALHSPYLLGMACTTCHLKNNPYSGNGQDTKSVGHEGMKSGDDCSKSGCHKPLGNRGSAYTNWD